MAVLAVLWFVATTVRSKRLTAMRQARADARVALTRFAQAATKEESVGEIVAAAVTVAGTIFKAHRFVLVQEDDNGWVASQPVGPPPPPVPTVVRGLFAWFKHNPLIACEVDLPKARFGAMRSPLKALMDTYAFDVVMPLVYRDELIALMGMAMDRKPNHLERDLLRTFRLEVTAACANVRLHHEAAHLSSLAEEVDLANSIELAMVPDKMDGDEGRMHWAGHFDAAGKAGSDFWGIYPLEGDRVMVVVGDAVGKDLAGTLVSAVVKSCCDQVFSQRPKELDPGRLLAMLNDSLYRPTRPALASCSAVIFDPGRSLVSYANAGHLPPYRAHAQREGLEVNVLKGTGPLLGDLKNPDFQVHSQPLSSADTFLFLTDGLLAPRDAKGDSYGYRRFHRLLRRQDSADPQALRTAILSGIASHSSETKLWDDQALLLVKYS